MPTVPQFYGGTGAPLDLAIEALRVAPAWFGHRVRFTDWLAARSPDEWDGPTRCDEWSVAGVVRHLTSVAEFEGFTLHQASKGEATRLLEGFDTQVVPQAAAALLAELDPNALLGRLRAADTRIEETVAGWSAADWSRPAEGPPGQMPAHLSLAHMLFDSWVHEHDLLDPRDETPLVVPVEVEIVVTYVVGLAGFVTGIVDGSGATADLRVSDTGLRVGLDATGDRSIVRTSWAPDGAPVVTGTAAAILDVATGRADGDILAGDPEGIAVLSEFSAMLRP